MESTERKEELRRLLRIDAKESRVSEIEVLMKDAHFWDDHRAAAKVAQELKHLNDFLVEFELAENETELEKLELEIFFTGPHDEASAFLAVHSGSGGVEAQDWAEMLLRMYERWAEGEGYKTVLLDETRADEAGIKSATLQIEGFRAYGRLKGENGVHRLVRISPFDGDKSRHTSFALVEVVPELEKSEVTISPDEIKIDVFRSGGAGGQSVNTTDSAVRITHLASKIVVTCQNERSQLQNRLQALKILQGKLQLLSDEKHRIANENLKGEPVLASWGNQIRSYVLQPYQLVKDLRSGFETTAVDKVLNGELNNFIEAYAKYLARSK
ncbi:hypothetical protein A3A71_02040 [Candidatus Berkelbacteria bacterium RIFCSPLOWO2_01_FULL_50_28]|uniref:Peptide chain release factor 2 n=1 Tax=Candidatus Berkelbacteria bacterium RIFCSPLOWO2_01_FULL_50_28 TaxID=1797471 RepID=A0A1F5EC62_9BACT|nr:MAG: hypothetical protein A2807_00435 [Candidatus Berkelbacteria bacterium RIFCSPHIGHO2_01_FULL_50_36]OGD63218.1 MAG: hypothetical protein A3F39_02305 [Candidatus Berkelbacteria bacterium RIFCSPHIGHO2_12_FULL_50_11]OGD64804.1 MAG: hypothetical protein A3A71_02040 [Candidatus Berkelbacteria bacterium RIFCSPLOWO2_01_FULL_50_28]